jgi:hypothetical protein
MKRNQNNSLTQNILRPEISNTKILQNSLWCLDANVPTRGRQTNKLNRSYMNLLEALLCAKNSRAFTCNGAGRRGWEEICKAHADEKYVHTFLLSIMKEMAIWWT